MKNTLQGINNRVDEEEGQISNLGKKETKTKSEQQKLKLIPGQKMRIK